MSRQPRKRRTKERHQRKQPYKQKSDRQKAAEHATPRADVYLPQGPLVENGLGVESSQFESFQFGVGFKAPGSGGQFNAGVGYEGGHRGPSPALIAIAGCLISTILIAAGILCAYTGIPGSIVAGVFGMAVVVFTISAGISIREQNHRRVERQAQDTILQAATTEAAPTAVEINQPQPERPKALESGEPPA